LGSFPEYGACAGAESREELALRALDLVPLLCAARIGLYEVIVIENTVFLAVLWQMKSGLRRGGRGKGLSLQGGIFLNVL
jgi:hypothetical protein